MTRTSARRRWMRAVRARRRWLVAVLLAGSVLFALESLAPPRPPTTPVVVAADDLLPGATLRQQDLDVVAWPTDLAPPGALHSVQDAAGAVLAAAVGQGELITGLRLVGPALTRGLVGSGQVSVPVRLADAASAGLLRPGDRVDLVAAQAGAADPLGGGRGTSSAHVVASGATVVTVPRSEGSSTFGVDGAAGALVVVATTRSEALALSEAAVLGPVSVVLVG